MTFLAVFDFDQTLLNENTDVAIQKLSPGGKIPDEIHEIARNQGWTEFVNGCLAHFHANKIPSNEILKFIREMPYVDGAIDMLKTLKNDLKADIIIISDANSIYIDESLKSAGVRDLISEIYTNPARISDEDQIIMTPFDSQTECNLSARNLCKGKVMLNFIKDKKYKFIMYAGDGGNDFCPIEKLTPNDLAFVRKGYALEEKIPRMKEKKNLHVKAKIHLWTNAHEIMTEVNKKLTAQ